MNWTPWLPIILLMTLFIAMLVAIAGGRSNRARQLPVDERAGEFLAAGLLPLAECPRDRNACLRCLQVDRCVVHRLLELGLTPGTELRVVQDSGGPMLVSVRGSRVALGRDLAEKLWVELSMADLNTSSGA